MRSGLVIVEPFEWKRRVCLNGCQVHDNPEDCSGPIEGHHLITQQALRKHGLQYMTWDTRNGLAVCQRAHRRHTGAVERIPYERLTAAAVEFAEEQGLTYLLDRYYPRLGDSDSPAGAA